jgi:hypothetical protein
MDHSSDPVLRNVRRLSDVPYLSQRLEENWSSLELPAGTRLDGITTHVVKLAPERRGTLRHELHLGGDRVVIYSKTFGDAVDCASVLRNIEILWRAEVCRGGGLMIPRPLFYVKETNTIFLQGLDGGNAHEHLDELDVDEAAGRIGRWLAGIHQCPMERLQSRPDQDMAKLDEAEELLGAMPEVAGLVPELRRRRPGLTSIPAAPIHGAFRLSQFLWVGGSLALVDLDGFVLGNPISDVGSFVAHLLYLPLKDTLTLEQSRSASGRFCKAYESAAPWGLPLDVLAWQTAAHLVGKQAKKLVKRPKKNQGDMASQLLQLAATILAGLTQFL